MYLPVLMRSGSETEGGGVISVLPTTKMVGVAQCDNTLRGKKGGMLALVPRQEWTSDPIQVRLRRESSYPTLHVS